jgi:NhaA family Na+:H+ antiporter
LQIRHRWFKLRILAGFRSADCAAPISCAKKYFIMDEKQPDQEAKATGPGRQDRDCADLTAAVSPSTFPDEPIDSVIDPLKRFLHIESAGGIVLLAAAAMALVLANSRLADPFLSFWQIRAGVRIGSFSLDLSIQHWINDGLMAVFFFVVGLEVKRELVVGELRDIRNAALPVAAALGGMVVPAAFYLLLQSGKPAASGWGIPMATDIAFVVGVLALLKDRIPKGLRIMLLSLAIADDIGAILVIAVGYTQNVHIGALLLALGGVGAVLVMFRLGIRNMAVYAFCMLLVWLALHESGVHATLAGVVFGLLTPTRSWVGKGRLGAAARRTLCFVKGDGWTRLQERYATLRDMELAARKTIPPQQRFENQLHPWSGFVIMPLFALANAGVVVSPEQLGHPVAAAVACGLFLGKPAGIAAASWLAVKSGVARLPAGVGWGPIVGAGFLAGIGFTMALFVSGLALAGPLLDAAKIGILAASLLSAVVGAVLLVYFLPGSGKRKTNKTHRG